jgi:thiol-disulfide isomerase/thioredoxin
MASIYEITDGESHHNFIQEHSKAVIFFGSQFCGHCNNVMDIYPRLAATYPDVAFAHVEVSTVKPKPINLEGVPTLAFYRNQVAVDKVVGANENAIHEALSQL